jgi:hypothetical protein
MTLEMMDKMSFCDVICRRNVCHVFDINVLQLSFIEKKGRNMKVKLKETFESMVGVLNARNCEYF